MPNEPIEQGTSGSAWKATQVYAMAALCLVVGLALGYLFRGSQSPAPPIEAANPQPAATPGGMAGHMPSLEDMKKMADTKAAPLIDKLKSDPNNVDLLTQVGNIYKATHQFKDAATYYDKIVQIDPKNVAMRTELASCLYYNGDVGEERQYRHLSSHEQLPEMGSGSLIGLAGRAEHGNVNQDDCQGGERHC